MATFGRGEAVKDADLVRGQGDRVGGGVLLDSAP